MKNKMNNNIINNILISLREFKNSKYGNLVLSIIALYIFFKISHLIFPFLQVLSWDISFLDPSSPFCESLIDLYYVVWYVLIVVLVGVIYILVKIITMFTWNINFVNFEFMKDVYNFYLKFFLSVFFIFFDFFKRTNMIPFISSVNLKNNKKGILNFWYSNRKKKFLHVQSVNEYRTLESAWCVTPSVALMSIGNPTFGLIFSLDSTMDPAVTLQVTGHQWYWTYKYEVTMHVSSTIAPEYQYTDRERFANAWNEKFFPKLTDDGKLMDILLDDVRPSPDEIAEYFENVTKLKAVIHYNITFDSTMISVEDLNSGESRLYQVSDFVVLPVGVPIKVLITSADVLHSWSVPSLGIKVDAVPGRINQFVFEIKYPGRYFGQCSELCGSMHSFMPIVLKVVTVRDFEQWVVEKGTIN